MSVDIDYIFTKNEGAGVFLLGQTRSGTNVFRRMLATHPEVLQVGEIFNEYFERNYFSFIQRELEKDPKLSSPSSSCELFERYIAEVLESSIATHSKVIFDAKLETLHHVYKPWQSYDEIPILEILKKRRLHVILLVRKNHVARDISQELSHKTKVYKVSADQVGHRHLVRVTVPIDGICERYDAREKLYEYIQEYFQAYERFTVICYEELFDVSNGVQVFSADLLRHLSSFLGLDDRFDNKPLLQKQNTFPIAEVVENYQELTDALKDTKYAHLLD